MYNVYTLLQYWRNASRKGQDNGPSAQLHRLVIRTILAVKQLLTLTLISLQVAPLLFSTKHSQLQLTLCKLSNFANSYHLLFFFQNDLL